MRIPLLLKQQTEPHVYMWLEGEISEKLETLRRIVGGGDLGTSGGRGLHRLNAQAVGRLGLQKLVCW